MQMEVRGASAPPGADLLQQPREAGERALEGGPMIAVEPLSHALPDPRCSRTPDAPADRLVPGLQVMEAGREQVRVRGPDQQVVKVAAYLLLDPIPLLLVEDRAAPFVQDAARTHVHHDESGRAEVAVVAPPLALSLTVLLRRELPQFGTRLAELANPPVELILLQLPWREVADELVDPIGHQPRHDALLPPRPA